MIDGRSSMLNNCGSQRMSGRIDPNVMRMKEKAAGLSIVQKHEQFQECAIPEEAAYGEGLYGMRLWSERTRSASFAHRLGDQCLD